MDLSFTRFQPEHEMTVLPADLAVLLVGAAARQVGSPTALVQIGAEATDAVAGGQNPRLFAPSHGAFNIATAASLRYWQDE